MNNVNFVRKLVRKHLYLQFPSTYFTCVLDDTDTSFVLFALYGKRSMLFWVSSIMFSEVSVFQDAYFHFRDSKVWDKHWDKRRLRVTNW